MECQGEMMSRREEALRRGWQMSAEQEGSILGELSDLWETWPQWGKKKGRE